MSVGIIILALGVVLVLLGGVKSARQVKRAHGAVDSVSVRMSEGTGVVPKWVSQIVLLGYAAIVVGAIVVVVSIAS